MKKFSFLTLMCTLMALSLSSCLNKDSDYEYYRKLLDDGNAKYECFATVHAIKNNANEVTGYWFDYNGYRYSPADNPIKEQYSPVDEYGRNLDGNRVYLVFEAADNVMNKDKEITLVGVRNIPTEDIKDVATFDEADSYGNDPLKIDTYNLSADRKFIDLVLTVKGSAVSTFKLLNNAQAQADAGVNFILDLKHEKRQSADENAEFFTFISFRLPDGVSAGKDNIVVRYIAEGGSEASLFIPTL